MSTPCCSQIHIAFDTLMHTTLIRWMLMLSDCGGELIWTTQEWTSPRQTLYSAVARLIVYLPVLVLLSPLALVGLVARIGLGLTARSPVYQYRDPTSTGLRYVGVPVSSKNTHESSNVDQPITVTTANLCLLPEIGARFNNFSGTWRRLRTMTSRMDIPPNGNTDFKPYEHYTACDHSVTSTFLSADILCCQEVWSRYYAEELASRLSHRYSYFVYDIIDLRFPGHFTLFGSGLFLASRFPLISVQFECFRKTVRHTRFTTSGLLQVKVDLGQGRVGLLATTHLQSFQGDQDVISQQLDEIAVWTRVQRRRALLKGETIAFDILCGDFNFDPLSPGDLKYANHPLFQDYRDPCKDKDGLELPWTVGTEFRQRTMHEQAVRTPDQLRKAVCVGKSRRRYLLDADVVKHTFELMRLPPPSSDDQTNSETWGRRRIDYILYSVDTPVTVSAYQFSTALTQLTDHLPVSMTFRDLNTSMEPNF